MDKKKYMDLEDEFNEVKSLLGVDDEEAKFFMLINRLDKFRKAYLFGGFP